MLKWSKPQPSGDLLQELGSVAPDICDNSTIIDLIASPQPLIPENVTKFGKGRENIADGLEISWKKNSRALAEHTGPPTTPEEIEREIDSRKHRWKRLSELRKNANLIGDSETANNLKQQMDEQRKEIKKLEEMSGSTKRSKFTL